MLIQETITFTTVLIVSSILSNNQAIIQSQDINTGLVLGSFTISNTSPGISIFSQSPIDNNNVTSGNSSVVTFSNVFLNPSQSLLTFSTTINSELGDVDTQSFPFSIICLCAPNDSSSSVPHVIVIHGMALFTQQVEHIVIYILMYWVVIVYILLT